MTILKKRRGKNPRSKDTNEYKLKVEYGWMKKPCKMKVVVVKKAKRRQKGKVVAKKKKRKK